MNPKPSGLDLGVGVLGAGGMFFLQLTHAGTVELLTKRVHIHSYYGIRVPKP